MRYRTGVHAKASGLDPETIYDGRAAECGFATYTATPVTAEVTTRPGLDGEGIEAVEWVERLPENALDRELVAALR